MPGIGLEEEFKEKGFVYVVNAKCHLCPDQVAIQLLED